MDPYVSILIVFPAMFLLGVLLQKYLIAPVMEVESILPENQVLLTVGIGLVLSNLALLLFTANYRSVPVTYASKTIYWDLKAGGQTISLSFSVPMIGAFAIALVLGRRALPLPRPDRPRPDDPGHGAGQARGRADGDQHEADHLRDVRPRLRARRGGRRPPRPRLLPLSADRRAVHA